MKSQVLNNFDMQWLTVTAFVLFLVFFISVVIWTFRTGSKDLYKQVGDIPFTGEDRNE